MMVASSLPKEPPTPFAQSQRSMKPRIPPITALIKAQISREDQGVQEIALAADAAEEVQPGCRITSRTVRDKAGYEFPVVKLPAGSYRLIPVVAVARQLPRRNRPPLPSARSRVEVHANLLSHRHFG